MNRPLRVAKHGSTIESMGKKPDDVIDLTDDGDELDRLIDVAAADFLLSRAKHPTIRWRIEQELRGTLELVNELQSKFDYDTPSRSTTKTSVSSGPMTPPAPPLP